MRAWSRHSLLIALQRDARAFVCLCLMVLALPLAHGAAMQTQPEWASICTSSGVLPDSGGRSGTHDNCLCVVSCGCLSAGCSKMPASAQTIGLVLRSSGPGFDMAGLAVPGLFAVSTAAHAIRAPPLLA